MPPHIGEELRRNRTGNQQADHRLRKCRKLAVNAQGAFTRGHQDAADHRAQQQGCRKMQQLPDNNQNSRHHQKQAPLDRLGRLAEIELAWGWFKPGGGGFLHCTSSLHAGAAGCKPSFYVAAMDVACWLLFANPAS